MAISLRYSNLNWEKIKENKTDWMLVIGVGFGLTILFNLWLYADILTDDTLGYRLRIAFSSIAFQVSWGLAFGFGGGIVSYKSDFIEQLVMTFISAFVLYLLVSIITLQFSAVFFLVFGLIMTLIIGVVVGYGINYLFIKYVLKIREKEIEERNYIDYRKI